LKTLFVHDHTFFVTETGNVFSTGKLSYNILKQYLKFFDELLIIGRSARLKDASVANLDISSGEFVSFDFMPNLAHPSKMIQYCSRVIKSLKKHIQEVDAVIARTSLLGQLAAEISFQMRKPLAIEVVGCPWDAYWNYGSLMGRFYAPLAWLWQRRVLKRSQFAIYVTQNFLQERYPSQGVTAGVSDVNLPQSDVTVFDKRVQRIHNPGNPVVFGLIGSLNSKYKGIQTALSALHRIRERLPKFEFNILGSGDPSYWIQLAGSYRLNDCVKFVGTLPSGEAVFQWLDQVDVYLQPSLTEGLPRSLVEAMSRACPAIGSTAGGIPELLDSEVLHKPGDADHLSRLIEKSLNTGWLLNQAKRNFEIAQYYTTDVLAQRRDKFWQSFADYVRSQKGA